VTTPIRISAQNALDQIRQLAADDQSENPGTTGLDELRLGGKEKYRSSDTITLILGVIDDYETRATKVVRTYEEELRMGEHHPGTD